ncbi:MAG: hypothetical protein WCF84_26635 [Anaerolineae bacterium]
MPTIPELLRDHVSLDVHCVDRIYLNGYVPTLQTSGAIVYFLEKHRKALIASPALLGDISQRFVTDVEAFAKSHHIPLVHFEKGQRKDDVAARLRRKFKPAEGVVFIGVAQEQVQGFKAHRETKGRLVRFQFSRQWVYVKVYYFYLQDAEFGPGFIKIATYAPYPVKVCLNGHEWAKQQLRRAGLAFESLDNGFLSCADPARLQALCEQLGPEQVQAFFDKWVARLPWPLTPDDRAAGYTHRLSIWQMEVSRTQIFTRPLQGRAFFEQIIRENLDLGRPDRVQLIFGRRVYRNTPSRFCTRVVQSGIQPNLHLTYKHSSVKQYFKENRALRTETTINNPLDFKVRKDLSSWTYLRKLGTLINERLLESERVSQDCLLSSESFARVSEPTRTEAGERAPGLRFGQPRAMALFAALTRFLPTLNGFRNAELRQTVQALLNVEPEAYTASQMSYDLRRLRLKGVIVRVEGSHRYMLTTYGRRVAYLMTKLHQRIFDVAGATLQSASTLPAPLVLAFRRLDAELDKLVADATLAPAGI